MLRQTRRTFLVVAAAAMITTSACGSSSPAARATTTTPLKSTTSTTTAPTTTLPAKATTGFFTAPEAAAHLVAAWKNHDRAAASQGADAIAVEGIFATPDPTMWLRGCNNDPSLGEGGCIYRTESGAVTINTEHRDIGWVVSTADYGTR